MPTNPLVPENDHAVSRANATLIEKENARDAWRRFYATLRDVDRQLLDRASLGYRLKPSCFELGVSYDTFQKRLKRWQQQLELPSLQVLLVVWHIARTSEDSGLTHGLLETAPALLRHASALAAGISPNDSMELTGTNRRTHERPTVSFANSN